MQTHPGKADDATVAFVSARKGVASVKRFAFTKTDRIRTPSAYRELSAKGARYYSDDFILVTRKSQLTRSRLGITVSKKVGKAVNRNRIKRILREWFRLNSGNFPVRLDINVIVRQTSGKIGSAELRDRFARCMSEAVQKAKAKKRHDDQAG